MGEVSVQVDGSVETIRDRILNEMPLGFDGFLNRMMKSRLLLLDPSYERRDIYGVAKEGVLLNGNYFLYPIGDGRYRLAFDKGYNGKFEDNVAYDTTPIEGVRRMVEHICDEAKRRRLLEMEKLLLA